MTQLRTRTYVSASAGAAAKIKPLAPLRPLRTALVGRGRWGACIERTIGQMPEFVLCWVCDPAQRPALEENPCGEQRWARALTADICRQVDVVIVATPAKAHVEPTLLALEADKAVFVEKPFTTTYSDALKVASAADGRVLMVGHLLVYHPAYQALFNLIQQGALGTIERVDVERCSPVRMESAASERCPWWTLAPHDLSILTRVFGSPEKLWTQRSGNGVTAELRWPNAAARLQYATDAHSKIRRTTVSGSAARVEIDELKPRLTLICGNATQELRLPSVPPLMQELRHFAECAHGWQVPETGIADALENVLLLEQGANHLNSSSCAAARDGYSLALGVGP